MSFSSTLIDYIESETPAHKIKKKPKSNFHSSSFKGAKALMKKGNRQLDDDNSDDDQNNEGDKENPNASENQNDQPKVKKTKKRKNVSTVTKNPDCLNARLDTIPLTDPFFAKMNSVIGDTTSSKRLMQNIIPTEDSKLKLRQNMAIWKSKDQKELNLEVDRVPDPLKEVIVISPSFQNVNQLNIRLGLATYRVCNEPIDQYEDDSSFQNRYDDLNNTVVNNATNVGLQFDINAAVEPVTFEKSVIMDFGDMDQGDFEDLNEMDRVAIDRCKGLRRQAIIIEDMQPEETSNLEYSYRPLDMIDQFWAGPSHWKFRQSRRTNHSIGSRMSQLTSASVNVGTAGQRNKIVRKRKPAEKLEATLEDAANVEDDMEGVLLKTIGKVRGNQLSNHTITRKWDSKKHKLPLDYKIPHDIFDKYSHASGLQINSNHDATFAGNDDDAAPYNYDNETDRDYCSRVIDMQSDTETETNTDMGQMDNNFDNLDMPPPPVPVDEIPDFFLGAPEKTEKINIAFARRAKVVDMKELKSCSWTLINNKHASDPAHNPTFSETLKDLPKYLTRKTAENMSMPLAFYAILHLCNDKNLLLTQDTNIKDFVIQFLEEEKKKLH